MKNHLYLSFLLLTSLLIVSCSEESSSETTSTPNTNTDTSSVDTVLSDSIVDSSVVVEPEINEAVFNMDSLMLKFSETINAPLNLDSTTIANWYGNEVSMESNLNYKEVQYFSQNILKHSRLHDGVYTLEKFVELDSLRRYNAYEEYMEEIDLGMTVTAEANSLKKLVVAENKYFLIWGVYTATYEACPYYSGSILYATLVENNEVKNTTVIGEISGGADAPYWGGTLLTSLIDSTGIEITIEETNGGDYDPETDEEIVDYSKEYQSVVYGIGGLESIGE